MSNVQKNSMSYETADSHKEEFRKYLEKSGVVNQLTRVLVSLYEEPERPTQALEYIKKYLGTPSGIDIDELKAENEELKKRNDELQANMDALMSQLEQVKRDQEIWLWIYWINSQQTNIFFLFE